MPFPEDVAEGVRSGDPDAVGRVYVALADRLLGYLMARVPDRATAEDLLEMTFLELLLRGSTIRGGPAAMKVWLFRAAHYNALDHLRKVKRRAEDLYEDAQAIEVADHGLGPEDCAVAGDVSRRVRALMDELSDEQRQVLLLRYVGGLTAPETGRVLGKTDGAVRSLQHRGERALARLLEHESGRAAPSLADEAS
ncbi:MAG TPA: RNA polymerase sigma factor [Egibacteraceae bacterium]|nr:RNA polymerase sigma factor [Egibacteraceae bacterium]